MQVLRQCIMMINLEEPGLAWPIGIEVTPNIDGYITTTYKSGQGLSFRDSIALLTGIGSETDIPRLTKPNRE